MHLLALTTEYNISMASLVSGMSYVQGGVFRGLKVSVVTKVIYSKLSRFDSHLVENVKQEWITHSNTVILHVLML